MLRSVMPRMKGHSSGKKPKSILKQAKPRRPPPLCLAPNPYSHVMMPSPHVHFPPSAALISTFATHSPNSYDRGAISVSPNRLQLPARGERVYSPSTGSFVDCEPVSPLVPSDSAIDNRLDYSQRSPVQLGKSLQQYPRSPYPTASIMGIDHETDRDKAEYSSMPTRSRTIPSRRKVIPPFLTLGAGTAAIPRISSPLALTTFGPSTSLNQAFWEAVQLSTDQEHERNVCGISSIRGDVPNFAFATKDGNMWSPGLSTRATHGSTTEDIAGMEERGLSMVKSPDPDDAFAGFPSFSAVLLMDGYDTLKMVTYPEKARRQL